ncbi:hypothetical protein KRX57_00520 [Weeksellaceae bacterium TAE3-ERU29]|nr:hypothetical protein [Weeksellaceae bacterium TAE3-ERU29]
MKKLTITLSALVMIAFTSCDPKGKEPQNVNPVEQQELNETPTPEQYQGSTGVDEAMGGLNVTETIELKEQTFKGSLSTDFTSNYEFTVLDEAKDYSFSLNSKNKNIVYSLEKENGESVFPPTQENKTVKLQPGEYTINAGLKEGTPTNKVDVKDTYFEIEIK